VRIATYNIHKCVGIDRRRSVERIARVIHEIDADVVALQEVVSDPESGHDQAAELAERLGMLPLLGPAIEDGASVYGNLILTRLQVLGHENFRLPFRRREPRAIHRVDIEIERGVLHFYNTHFSTSYRDRCDQSRQLFESRILEAEHPEHPQVLVGDFNEWFGGKASRALGDYMHEATRHIRPTYPSMAPLFKLDRVYVNQHVKCRRVWAHTTRLARVASDHVPIVADIEPIVGGER